MKHLGSHLLSIVLSLLVVVLGVGVQFVHCQHSNAIAIAAFSEMGQGMEAPHRPAACHDEQTQPEHMAAMQLCNTNERCFDFHELRLTPTTVHSLQTQIDGAVSFILPPYLLSEGFAQPASCRAEALPTDGTTCHAPPRQYLRRLCTLLI